ncbi:MAG: hypothetical protein Q7S84_02520 [bacterium]|nr:hypothetical protein [bacterium]
MSWNEGLTPQKSSGRVTSPMQETATHSDEQTLYEVTFLQVHEDSSAVRETLRTHHATIQEERPMEKVHLAYPIGKQVYAFMGSFRFTVDENLSAGPLRRSSSPASTAGRQALAKLRTDLKLGAAPLRFMIHRAERVSERQSERSGERPAVERGPRPSSSPASEPLTNEALERKISEILQ